MNFKFLFEMVLRDVNPDQVNVTRIQKPVESFAVQISYWFLYVCNFGLV